MQLRFKPSDSKISIIKFPKKIQNSIYQNIFLEFWIFKKIWKNNSKLNL